MTGSLDDIVSNAQEGYGPCRGCPAHADTQGQYVNPGLLNYDGDIMFLTMDPSHWTDWSRYDSWTEYNEAKTPMFKNAKGGQKLSELLEPLGYGLEDVWLADSVKCPSDNDLATDVDTGTAFTHCVTYLEHEIEAVNPEVIVTLGNGPGRRLLRDVFDIETTIKAGTRDCGRRFETEPPVVISPHWAHGWLDRGENMEKVSDALRSALNL